MKPGWEVKKLGDLATVIAGQSPKSSAYNQNAEGLPFYQGKKDYGERFLLAPTKWTTEVTKEALAGDILMSVRAPVGPLNEATETICIGRGLAAIRAKCIDQNYLWHALTWLQPNIAGNEGAVFASINKAQIANLRIPLPPLAEQKRIVSILDKAFEGLDRARENAEANLKSARELFSEAVRLNLKERDNWVTATLSKCFRLKSGDNLTSKSMVTGPFEVYGGNGVAGKHNASNLSGDNVIVGRVGALCGRARCISKDIWLTDNAFKVVDYNYDFDPRFLARLLNFLNLGSLARQAAQPVISNSSLKDLILKFPKERTEQTAIADNLDKYEFKIDTARSHYRTKLQDISDLRQSLLQKAFAGELT